MCVCEGELGAWLCVCVCVREREKRLLVVDVYVALRGPSHPQGFCSAIYSRLRTGNSSHRETLVDSTKMFFWSFTQKCATNATFGDLIFGSSRSENVPPRAHATLQTRGVAYGSYLVLD